ncbi:MAG: HgcAB-associated protein [Bryobacterales bacterium]|nr:HgcAB-associated protein [Bryobacteraceae bacterium]MDW8353033.1 HgcAB-associated protein [Bryobacterales bacterium]
MTTANGNCCAQWRVESLVTVDERGQMVLPKGIREKARIGAGDKLALVVWEQNGEVCCLMLVKADELSGMVRDRLGAVLRSALDV